MKGVFQSESPQQSGVVTQFFASFDPRPHSARASMSVAFVCTSLHFITRYPRVAVQLRRRTGRLQPGSPSLQIMTC